MKQGDKCFTIFWKDGRKTLFWGLNITDILIKYGFGSYGLSLVSFHAEGDVRSDYIFHKEFPYSNGVWVNQKNIKIEEK